MRTPRYNRETLADVVKQSISISDLCRWFKITCTPSNYNTFKKYIKLWGLDTSHFDRRKAVYDYSKRVRANNEDIFKKDSTYPQTRLKKRILEEGLIDYKCECDNIGTWRDKKLVLQLDHINGIHDDNTITNLRFLCPNCHSQTDTFTSKNKRNRSIV